MRLAKPAGAAADIARMDALLLSFVGLFMLWLVLMLEVASGPDTPERPRNALCSAIIWVLWGLVKLLARAATIASNDETHQRHRR